MNRLVPIPNLLLMHTAVTVNGKPGHIRGRSFVHERYDVRFEDNSILHGLPRDLIEIGWRELVK